MSDVLQTLLIAVIGGLAGSVVSAVIGHQLFWQGRLDDYLERLVNNWSEVLAVNACFDEAAMVLATTKPEKVHPDTYGKLLREQRSFDHIASKTQIVDMDSERRNQVVAMQQHMKLFVEAIRPDYDKAEVGQVFLNSSQARAAILTKCMATLRENIDAKSPLRKYIHKKK